MEFWQYITTIVATVVTTLGASSGFWIWIQKRAEKKDSRTQLLLAMAHDRIFYLGLSYIERGYITREDLTGIQKYLAKPYFELSGNGAVKRIMEEVEKLPIRSVNDLIAEAKEKSNSVNPTAEFPPSPVY